MPRAPAARGSSDCHALEGFTGDVCARACVRVRVRVCARASAPDQPAVEGFTGDVCARACVCACACARSAGGYE